MEREKCKNPEKTAVSRGSNALKVAGTGFEQRGKPTIRSENSNQGETESNALATGDAQIDSDLEFITRVWSELSETVRKQLVEIVVVSQET